MKKLLLALALIWLGFNTTGLSQTAQDTATVWRVETRDGNTFVGTMVFQDSETLRIKTSRLGEISIPKADIVVMKPVPGRNVVGGDYWPENPLSSRHFWGPSGYGLKKGEGYYQNIWVLWNQASFGITNNFSIGGGMIPLFFFGGTSTPIWVVPKLSFPVTPDKFNLGAGALLMTVVGEESEVFGIVYGVSTFGPPDKQLTLGLGYGFAGNDWAQAPAVTLSGAFRTGKRGFLITENYFLDAGDSLVFVFSAGGRWAGRRITIDYGGILPAGGEIGSFVLVPWLGITLPFGTK